jgi:hypothetical protein
LLYFKNVRVYGKFDGQKVALYLLDVPALPPDTGHRLLMGAQV